ncbi:hypothetical protein BCL90_2907 [Pedobacter alluvionis]|uniref:Uncharacterized protein n=1 Tax=Pedobacter alluvionis TaxID=475253 RepID=A0A497Y4G8_9SPHI|nr:hypothetical protein BCL90_2907 [Pedobacter alluvionis]
MNQQVPIENYQIIFLGGGKLVAIRIPNEPIGLKFISDDETESVVYEQAIFHRKNKGGSTFFNKINLYCRICSIKFIWKTTI